MVPVVSTDTDMVPALDAVCDLTRAWGTPKLEVASWGVLHKQLRVSSHIDVRVHWHAMSEADHDLVRDDQPNPVVLEGVQERRDHWLDDVAPSDSRNRSQERPSYGQHYNGLGFLTHSPHLPPSAIFEGRRNHPILSREFTTMATPCRPGRDRTQLLPQLP